MYHYAGNSPVRYIDPDGESPIAVVGAVAAGIGLHFTLVSAAQNGIFPNEVFGFYFDSETNLYHATFDCWQGSLFYGYLSYNKFYDVIFDIVSSMRSSRFDFSSGGKDYVLWAWKGDYINLGAGCELGIYEKAPGVPGALGHFIVKKDLAMNIRASLTLKGKNIGNFSGFHWWGTIFNPFERGVNAKDLTAKFSVDFAGDTQMYSDFKNTWKKDARWFFDDKARTATLTF